MSVYGHAMDQNEKPRPQRLEEKIEHRVLPVLYAIGVVFGLLILLALVILSWQEVL